MAASDKPFHNQRVLDIVFAVSNILMLVSVIWMLYADYQREYKVEQREFLRIQQALHQRLALEQIPSEDDFKTKEQSVKDARAEREKKINDLTAAQAALLALRPSREREEAAYQTVAADISSIQSFYNIALEHGDTALAAKHREELKNLETKRAAAQKSRDEVVNKMKGEQLKIERIEGPVTKAVAEFKKINDKLDTQVKIALTKRWTINHTIRTLPVINGFADPLRIHQFAIYDIPIDYNFKQVPRFDRCMSCHVGIENPTYSRANLEALVGSGVSRSKLATARDQYDRRKKAINDPKESATIPNPSDLQLIAISKNVLTPARITEFAAHPRLDLFVGSNSKHPAEKFGCTSCHSGQGSGTSFRDASHTPNSSKSHEKWTHDRGWVHDHMWDFPMLPARFVESSCLKCHHQVTDLITSDNKVEAPKLLKGYDLIRENGCFGCHEISGWKSGQRVGPDMRLEPLPPLDMLHPIERDRAEKDIDNRPGHMRKVGPSLVRVSEKVSSEWIAKWLLSPSSFRADTKMPHYYGMSNNNEDVLKNWSPDHEKLLSPEKFPNTEVSAIAHFLTESSNRYLRKADEVRGDGNSAKDDATFINLLNKGRLTDAEVKELADAKLRIKQRSEVKLVDQAPNHKDDAANGRILFTEKGCLACHTHQATEKGADKIAALKSDATFGPNLSELAAKFGAAKKDRDAKRSWLIQWILNPHVHSPRSRMPVTHLKPGEAADISAWLLAQSMPAEQKELWDNVSLKPVSIDDLKNLAQVYLVRMLSAHDMKKFLDGDLADDHLALVKNAVTKDEHDLLDKIKDNSTAEDALKFYVGKKAVSRLGCFGCHDVPGPGMDSLKSIGVGLNDWGKKDSDKLAFEDIKNFFEHHYYSVDSLDKKNGEPHGLKEVEVGKGDKKKKVIAEPYEKFFAEGLIGHHHLRHSYLNQKVRDPRSYDFNRIKSWDDRSRMPKFTLARPRKFADEDDSAFKGRMLKKEAEAREAVATFVLGLVADPVPTKATSQPTGDRLAEVKGRQILDKYNCNGCHMVRPGVYDFNLSDDTLKNLAEAHSAAVLDISRTGEIAFPNDNHWIGRNQLAPDRANAFGVLGSKSADDPWNIAIPLQLSEAFRFVSNGKLTHIPAGRRIQIPIGEFLPNGAGIDSQEAFDRHFANSSPHGGAFVELLLPYLNKKDPQKYLAAGTEARASLPPPLIGQGERTQGDWLYQFLLDPGQVRRMAILRMPKFNMSKEEARGLVDYFAAVARMNNTGIGLAYPFESLPQQTSLDGAYWQEKNRAYVKQLKETDARDKDGKFIKTPDGKGTVKAIDQRLQDYAPVFEQLRIQREGELKIEIKLTEERIVRLGKQSTELADALTKAKENADNAAKALKDAADKKDAKLAAEAKQTADRLADVEKDLAGTKQAAKDAEALKTKLEGDEKSLTAKDFEKSWIERDAYASDSYRLLTSRDLCSKCHQLGSIVAGEQVKQGPPLDAVSNRLRPDWIDRWVNNPARYVPYTSMNMYFHEKEQKWQHIHAGPALYQIQSVRDVLLNYPRVSSLPINRIFNPDDKK